MLSVQASAFASTPEILQLEGCPLGPFCMLASISLGAPYEPRAFSAASVSLVFGHDRLDCPRDSRCEPGAGAIIGGHGSERRDLLPPAAGFRGEPGTMGRGVP